MPFLVEASTDRVVIRDVPLGLWAFGAMFVASGLLVLSIPLLSAQWAGFTLWQRIAVLAIGVAHLAGGMWTVARYAATTTRVDRGTGAASHSVRSLFKPRAVVTRFHLSEVRAVVLSQHPDSDGDPMFRVDFTLTGSRTLPLQAQPIHIEKTAESRAASVRVGLGIPSSVGESAEFAAKSRT